jgi:hypothetical protein
MFTESTFSRSGLVYGIPYKNSIEYYGGGLVFRYVFDFSEFMKTIKCLRIRLVYGNSYGNSMN